HTTAGTAGVRTLVTDGDADGGSFSADGTIVIRLATSKLTFDINPPGTSTPPGAGPRLYNLNAVTRQTVGVLLETIDSTGAGGYIMAGNQACQPLGLPRA